MICSKQTNSFILLYGLRKFSTFIVFKQTRAKELQYDKDNDQIDNIVKDAFAFDFRDHHGALNMILFMFVAHCIPPFPLDSYVKRLFRPPHSTCYEFRQRFDTT